MPNDTHASTHVETIPCPITPLLLIPLAGFNFLYPKHRS